MHKKRISKKEMENLAGQLISNSRDAIEQIKYIQAGIQVREEVWEEFKYMSELEGLKLKHAVSQALVLWIQERKKTTLYPEKKESL